MSTRLFEKGAAEETAMSHGDLINGSNIPFHPASHYNSLGEVLSDTKLSATEKRIILSSWASNMYAVDSNPALREVPGMDHRLRLSDILAALRQLDDETDPPPRGGAVMGCPSCGKFEQTVVEPRVFGSQPAATRWPRIRTSHAGPRWTPEANVRRYSKLLNTKLTDTEREFIERRLIEELRGLNRTSGDPPTSASLIASQAA
jgi:hypothetical protein